MRVLRFTVPGPPVAWQRAGLDTRSMAGGRRRRRFFVPAKTQRFEALVWLACVAAGFRGAAWSGPIRLTVRLFVRDARRRDIDNFAKSVLDGLNHKAFTDDSQVVDLVMQKRISRRNPRTEVELEEIPAVPEEEP